MANHIHSKGCAGTLLSVHEKEGKKANLNWQNYLRARTAFRQHKNAKVEEQVLAAAGEPQQVFHSSYDSPQIVFSYHFQLSYTAMHHSSNINTHCSLGKLD